jgi:hypothetical protein
LSYDRPWYRKPPVGTPLARNSWTEGLQSFYALNEGAGPYAGDSAGSGLALAWQEPFSSWSTSPTGFAGTFLDGTNYGSTAGLHIAVGQPFSIAFRAHTSQASATAGLVSIGDTATSGLPLYLLQQSGSALRVLVGGIAYATIVPSVVAGQWYTISSSWDGATETHYVNGVLAYSGARSLGTINTPLKLFAGSGYNAVGKGGIEWVGVWGRALTVTEQATIGGDPGAIWGRLYRNRLQEAVLPSIPPGITAITPSSVYQGSTTSVSVFGFGTTWTPGSTTQFKLDSPPSGTSISSQSVTDATRATVTIQAGTSTGSFQLDDQGGHTRSMSVIAASFSASPSALPTNHGSPITLALTGSGTSWTSGSTVTIQNSVTGTTAVTKGTWTQISATSATLTVTTGAGVGTCTITIDGVASPLLSVQNAALAATPTDVPAAGARSLSLAGIGTLWTQSSPTGLFTTNFAGATISNIAVHSDTLATATLALSGSSGGTLTITDTSTGTTGTVTVHAAPSGSLHIAGPLVLQHSGGSVGLFGGQSAAWLAFRFRANSNAGLNLGLGTEILHFGTVPSGFGQYTVAYFPATKNLIFLFFCTLGVGAGQTFTATVPVQLGIDYHFLLAWSNGGQVLYVNGLPHTTASIAAGTFAYRNLQFGGNAGNAYGTSNPQAMDHTISDVAMGNGYVPTASEALSLAGGTLSPLQLATPALAWWPLGGGTAGNHPVNSDLTAAWGWLADYTGNGNTLSVAATTPSGSLSGAAYAAAIPMTSPIGIDAIIDKTGLFAVFGAFGATPVNGVYPPAAISALNATPTIRRDGTAVQAGTPICFATSGDCPLVMVPLECGGVRALAVADGGEGYTSPAVTPDNTGTGGSGLTLGTPLLQSGVTSYALANAGSGYAQPPILTITDPGGSGSGALGYCVVDPNGYCVGVRITAGGGNYSNPTGTITGGGGSGATVQLSQVGGIVQDDALMTAFGSGYNPPPGVTVAAPPNTRGPAGNKAAQARAIVYGSDAGNWGGTPGALRAIVPLVGGLLGCGQGYSSGSPPAVTVAAPPSGTTATATAVVSNYIAAVPVTNPGSGYNKPPTFAIADPGGTPARIAALRPIMSGASPSDAFTYDAPASWLAANLGGSGGAYGSWTQGHPVGGLQAVAGAAMTNWAGQVEGATGGLLGFRDTPTMLAGANLGALPVASSSDNFTAKNRLHATYPQVLRNGGALMLTADETPVSWTAGSVIGWIVCTSPGGNALDGMGDPDPYGVWTACYDDPQVNTAAASSVALYTWSDAANLVITPVMLSGPASPVAIPAANITMSGDALQSISLSGVSLVAGWQGAGVQILPVGGGNQGGGTANCVVTGGVPTAINVITGGSYGGGKPTVVLYGTKVSGTTVTAQLDYEYVPTTTPGTGPTEWASSVTFELAQPQGLWNLGNPWLVAPDVRTRGGTAIPFDRTNPWAVDDGILAMLTTPTGRTIGGLRFMDAAGSYGGATNYVNPHDLLPDGSSLTWLNRSRTTTVNFTHARAYNTNPALGPSPGNGTYGWPASTRIYAPQAWAVQGPDAAGTGASKTITGTLTAGSPLVTGVSDMGLLVASAISGAGIPAGATIAAVNQVFDCTTAGGSAAIQVHGGTSTLAVGMAAASQYLPAGTTVASVDGPYQVTLSGNAAGTGYVPVTFTGRTIILSAPATASGVQPLTVTSPGYISPPAADMGTFMTGDPRIGAVELRSDAPHGLSTGALPNLIGTTPVPLTGGGSTYPGGAISAYNNYQIWITGPYTIVIAIDSSPAGTGGIQRVNSSAELAVNWQAVLQSPPSPSCVSYEYAAEMCKQLGCRLWLNLPPAASDACLAAIAGKVAAHIGPTVHVHLEVGNELFTFGYMQAYFSSVQALIADLPAGTAVLGGTPAMMYTAGGRSLEYISQIGAYSLAAGHALDVFAAEWQALGMDPARLHRHVSGQFGAPDFALAGLISAQRTGRRVDHIHGAPYIGLPPFSSGVQPDPALYQAIAPAGSTFAAAGSLPADAINALNLYYINYAGEFWQEWAAEATQCQAFGQPLEPIQISGTTPGSTGLAPGFYYFYYTFVDGSGNETTVGLSQSDQYLVSATNIPNVIMPFWPPWAQALNWYVSSGTASGICTFYQQVTRSQYNSTYPAGSAFPFSAAPPAGTAKFPPSTTQVPASTTGPVPTLTCYEGSLQNPVNYLVPAYLDLLHDTFLHPSAADAFRGFQLMQQRGNPTVPGSGVQLACYFELFNQTQYPNMWFIAKGTAQMPGDGLGHAYAGSSTYAVSPNRYATIQGGYSADGFAPDGHDHMQYGVSPMLQEMRNWSDVASPMPVRPSAPQVVRTRRWFAGLSRSNARSGR